MSNEVTKVIQRGIMVLDQHPQLAAVFQTTHNFTLPVTSGPSLSGKSIVEDTGMEELSIGDQEIVFAAFFEAAQERGMRVIKQTHDRADGLNSIVVQPQKGGELYRGIHIGG